MSLPIARRLSRKSRIPIPSGVVIHDPFWYVTKGAHAGWVSMFKKYGRVPVDPAYRLKKWREWWEREGQYKPHPVFGVRKSIQRPYFSSRLAEFTGIVMGDGGITRRQVVVTMHSRDDRKYCFFVKNLIENLFHVPVSVRWNVGGHNFVNLIISRTSLVDFCHNHLGLLIGNKVKQGINIPTWIYKRRIFQVACIRGLVDTDGCFFWERHRIKGKIYSYPRISFVTASPLLRDSVFSVLKNLGFSPRIRKKQGVEQCVQLENSNEIRHYLETIGTHNPKHKRRFMQG